MSISTPSSPSSFDPAFHLHSEVDVPEPHLAPSQINSDDLEALHAQEAELKATKIGAGVVIQHRSWELTGTLHSEDVFNPETPSKCAGAGGRALGGKEQARVTERMPFSSSPVLYPQTSSPPTIGQKRKLFQSWKPEEPKKRKMLGGFILDEDDSQQERATVVELKHPEPIILDHRAVPESLAAKESNPILEQDGARSRSPSLPPLPQPDRIGQTKHSIPIITCSGAVVNVTLRTKSKQLSYEQTIAQRSTTAPGRAKKAYYGVDIHKLMDEHSSRMRIDAARGVPQQRDTPTESVERRCENTTNARSTMHKHQMWTEKYRARKFTDLIGDERTHRSVLRWLKSWDPIVFPGSNKSVSKKKHPFPGPRVHEDHPQHRKILLLTGPPGLGKTTLAHVIARQAGYEPLEINASDERSRDVVRGRIRNAVGTENVRGIDVVKGDKKTRKAGRPVCVIVDEVDGVVSGSSSTGGEGGFMKALIDLVQLDQRNSQSIDGTSFGPKKTRKGDNFRLLRPLILVCNDLYAPALRPLRTSSCAEIIHVRKPPLEKAISRLATIFNKEGISSDADAIRRLCEASWGIRNGKQNHSSGGGAGEGDIRGILVQSEWIAHKLRSSTSHQSSPAPLRLTKSWLEENVLSSSTDSPRGLGCGGPREIVERVFIEGAGLPKLPTKPSPEDARLQADSSKTNPPIGISDLRKRAAISSLREMADATGDHDRLMSDCFSSYPSQLYQDDTYLTKPAAAYEWLHFHDQLSHRVFSSQDWELNPYLSQGLCAFHHLFATTNQGNLGWDLADNHQTVTPAQEAADGPSFSSSSSSHHPFAGPRADFAAKEAHKANGAVITEFQSGFSAPLLRLYRSVDSIATELVPNLARMLAPDVKPVLVGGSSVGQGGVVASVRRESERNCVRIAARVMSGLNVGFERVRVVVEEIEGAGGGASYAHAQGGGFAMRMEPPLDTLSTFESSTKAATSGAAAPPVRYAVRQVLDQEHRKELLRLRSQTRLARHTGPNHSHSHPNHDSHPEPPIARDGGDDGGANKENVGVSVTAKKRGDGSGSGLIGGAKRDFFGRVINEVRSGAVGKGLDGGAASGKAVRTGEERVWVSFHEGFSNAVRKPITLREFLDSF